MKKILSVLLTIMLIVTMAAGCGSSSAKSSSTSSDASGSTGTSSESDEKVSTNLDLSKITIGVSVQSQTAPFWVVEMEKCKEYCENYGMKCIVTDGQGDANTQIQGIEDLISQKVDLIIVDPVEPAQLVQVTLDCKAAGIPVIDMSSTLDEGAYSITHIDCDNAGNCMMLGKYIAEKYSGTTLKVGVLSGIPGHINGQTRRDYTLLGLTEYQLEKDNKCTFSVVTQGWAYWAADTAVQVTEDMMTAAPDMNLIVCEAEDMARGAAQAVSAAGKSDQIKIAVCADASKTIIQGVMDGTYIASGVNNPVSNAKLAVDSAVKYLSGETLQSQITADAAIVTPENASQYYDPNSAF